MRTPLFNFYIKVVVAGMTAMLVAATALATDNAFADKKKKSYKKNQAISQVNCGNGFESFNVFCQNLASQLQGDDNSAALAGTQQGEEP
jgi:hypothetical protein